MGSLSEAIAVIDAWKAGKASVGDVVSVLDKWYQNRAQSAPASPAQPAASPPASTPAPTPALTPAPTPASTPAPTPASTPAPTPASTPAPTPAPTQPTSPTSTKPTIVLAEEGKKPTPEEISSMRELSVQDIAKLWVNNALPISEAVRLIGGIYTGEHKVVGNIPPELLQPPQQTTKTYTKEELEYEINKQLLGYGNTAEAVAAFKAKYPTWEDYYKAHGSLYGLGDRDGRGPRGTKSDARRHYEEMVSTGRVFGSFGGMKAPMSLDEILANAQVAKSEGMFWTARKFESQMGPAILAVKAAEGFSKGDMVRWATSEKNVTEGEVALTGLSRRELRDIGRQVVAGELTVEEARRMFRDTKAKEDYAKIYELLPQKVISEVREVRRVENKSGSFVHHQIPPQPRPYSLATPSAPSENYVREYERLSKEGSIAEGKPSAEYLAKYYGVKPAASVWGSRENKPFDYYELLNRYAEEKNVPEWKTQRVVSSPMPSSFRFTPIPDEKTVPYEYRRSEAISKFVAGVISEETLRRMFPEVQVSYTSATQPEQSQSHLPLTLLLPLLHCFVSQRLIQSLSHLPPTWQEYHAATKPAIVPDRRELTGIEYGKLVTALTIHGYDVPPEFTAKARYPTIPSKDIVIEPFTPPQGLTQIPKPALPFIVRDETFHPDLRTPVRSEPVDVFGVKINPIDLYLSAVAGGAAAAVMPAASVASVAAGAAGFAVGSVVAPIFREEAVKRAPSGELPSITLNLRPTPRIWVGSVETKEVVGRAAELTGFIVSSAMVSKAVASGLSRFEAISFKENLRTSISSETKLGGFSTSERKLVGLVDTTSKIETSSPFFGSRTTIMRSAEPLPFVSTPLQTVGEVKVSPRLPTMDWEVAYKYVSRNENAPAGLRTTIGGGYVFENVGARGIYTPRTGVALAAETTTSKISIADTLLSVEGASVAGRKIADTELGVTLREIPPIVSKPITQEAYAGYSSSAGFIVQRTPPTIAERISDNLKKTVFPLFPAEGRRNVLDTPPKFVSAMTESSGKWFMGLSRTPTAFHLGSNLPEEDLSLLKRAGFEVATQRSPLAAEESWVAGEKVSGVIRGGFVSDRALYSFENRFSGGIINLRTASRQAGGRGGEGLGGGRGGGGGGGFTAAKTVAETIPTAVNININRAAVVIAKKQREEMVSSAARSGMISSAMLGAVTSMVTPQQKSHAETTVTPVTENVVGATTWRRNVEPSTPITTLTPLTRLQRQVTVLPPVTSTQVTPAQASRMREGIPSISWTPWRRNVEPPTPITTLTPLTRLQRQVTVLPAVTSTQVTPAQASRMREEIQSISRTPVIQTEEKNEPIPLVSTGFTHKSQRKATITLPSSIIPEPVVDKPWFIPKFGGGRSGVAESRRAYNRFLKVHPIVGPEGMMKLISKGVTVIPKRRRK